MHLRRGNQRDVWRNGGSKFVCFFSFDNAISSLVCLYGGKCIMVTIMTVIAFDEYINSNGIWVNVKDETYDNKQ